MFFNSHFNIYAEKNMREDEEEDDDIGEMLLFYNGNKTASISMVVRMRLLYG